MFRKKTARLLIVALRPQCRGAAVAASQPCATCGDWCHEQLASKGLDKSMQDTDTRQQPVQSLLYAAQVDLISLIPALEQGTITPLHCDPYFNLFCQIWGSKYIRIYDRKHAQQLHPFSNPFLRNTSQVRVEKVDSKMFPSFDQVPYLECHLMPGEMLFMPKKFWHFVQALEPSWQRQSQERAAGQAFVFVKPRHLESNEMHLLSGVNTCTLGFTFGTNHGSREITIGRLSAWCPGFEHA
ncbi:hypothetical protein WJX77_006450 [Trebouxia sp. C0004]